MIKKEFKHNYNRSKTRERKTDLFYLQESFNVEKPKDFINSTIADMDFKTPKPIVNAINKRAKMKSYSYTYVTSDLYNSIINWYSKNHHLKLFVNNIKLVHGTVNTLHQIVKNLTTELDSIIINTPVYGPFLNVIKNANCTPIFSELKWNKNHYEFDLIKFEKLVKINKPKIFILCSPHNPGGTIWSKEILTRILNICRKYNVILISDEVHSDLVLSNNNYTSLLHLSTEEDQVVICNSPNKAFNLGGLKTSYIISKNNNFMNELNKIFEKNSLTSPNVFAIPAIKTAYNSKYIEKWLNKFKEHIEQNFFILKKELSNLEKLEIMELESSYLVWCKFEKFSYEKFFQETKKKGVIFSDYTSFANCPPNYFRINIASDKKTLLKICTILKHVLK